MAVNLQQFLKDFVGSRVSMTEEETRANVQVVKDVVERFVQCMKNVDPLFNELYQNIYYAGSFYEGLKVSDANEFDLNIVLNLPFKPEEVQAVHENIPKGFVMYKLRFGTLENQLLPLTRRLVWTAFMGPDKLMDASHSYLLQTKLNSWFHSLVDRTLQTYQAQFRNVKLSCSGPAKTLNITSPRNGCKLDVDLVPVVKLSCLPQSVTNLTISIANQHIVLPRNSRNPAQQNTSGHLPWHKTRLTPRYFHPYGNHFTRPYGMTTSFQSNQESNYFIVPKPPPSYIETRYGKDAAVKMFRVSIPDAERQLIYNKGCIKMLIKIFKAIRDQAHLTFISSYCIKTVHMWQLVKHPNVEFWSEAIFDKLFIMMLKEFIAVMAIKHLDHIFFNGYNLLADLQQGELDQAKIIFESVLKHAVSNVSQLYIMYNVPLS